jgi:hypothetical protein
MTQNIRLNALPRRFDAWFYAHMPRERLALLRLGIGAYALIYLLARASHLNAVVDYPASSFAPLGLVRLIREPLAKHWVYGLFAATLVTGALFTSGVFYRVAAPAFALLLLWVMSYRHAWGMIFHTDNLLVLHVMLLALAPAAEAYVYPRWRGQGSLSPEDGRHGWAVRALCLVTVASYVVAGVAKLTHTGWAWAAGGALREQVAYDAIRKIELGSLHSPFGPWLLPHEWLFPPLSAFSLATELLAPVALLSARLAMIWCVSAWLFHVGVLALMAIAFPYPLSGCAFLAFFPVERWVSVAVQRFKAPPRATGSAVGP